MGEWEKLGRGEKIAFAAIGILLSLVWVAICWLLKDGFLLIVKLGG